MRPARRRDTREGEPAECRQIAPLLPMLPDGDLPAADAQRVEAHLAACPACREEARAFLGMGAALRQVTPPEPNLPEGHAIAARIQEQEARRARHSLPRWAFVPALAALALVAFLGLRPWLSPLRPSPAWPVERVSGTPLCGAKPLPAVGQWRVGTWIETDAASRAKAAVADIGQVTIDPNTRVRLLETRADHHRLSLARGALEAVVSAPPRLFFVETPSAVAVDMGCAYRLEVDDAGRGLLRVTSGWVALAWGGRESLVPAGARCETRPGVGPGTPCFEDATPALREALARMDFENGGTAALATVLAEADMPDTLTLWHLLSRVVDTDRAALFDRLADLVPPPAGVTRPGVLRLDEGMLSLWKAVIQDFW